MAGIDWASVIDKERFGEFLKNRLGLSFSSIEKRFNDTYGTYFAVYFDKHFEDVCYFGKFGKLKIVEQNKQTCLVEDFDFSDQNALFLQEYLAFVNQENKVNDKIRRVKGKSYLTDFKDIYYNREKGKEE